MIIWSFSYISNHYHCSQVLLSFQHHNIIQTSSLWLYSKDHFPRGSKSMSLTATWCLTRGTFNTHIPNSTVLRWYVCSLRCQKDFCALLPSFWGLTTIAFNIHISISNLFKAIKHLKNSSSFYTALNFKATSLFLGIFVATAPCFLVLEYALAS